MLRGVFPVPPTNIFPTHITGKLNFFCLINKSFSKFTKNVIKVKGKNTKE